MSDAHIEYSRAQWKRLHDRGYFPNSDQHRDWKVFDAPPDWLVPLLSNSYGLDVLEIGCGYGEWMVPIAKWVNSIHGVDIHEAPIRKANEIFDERDLFRAVAKVGDGKTLPYPDAHFDLVYSVSVFQHIPRAIVHGYLHEAHRVLRPGGVFAGHWRNLDAAENASYPPLTRDITGAPGEDFSCGWTAAEVLDACEMAGFMGEVRDLGLFLVFVGMRP